MAERKRVRSKSVTDSARKRRKLNWGRQHPRISVGNAFERWERAKEEAEAGSHFEFATLLLDCWYAHRPNLAGEPITKRDVGTCTFEPETNVAFSSTPGVSGTVPLPVLDISDVEGSAYSSDVHSGIGKLSTDSECSRESIMTRFERKAAETEESFIRLSLLSDGEEIDTMEVMDPTFVPTASDKDEDADLDFDMSLCVSDQCSERLDSLPVTEDVIDFETNDSEEDLDTQHGDTYDTDVRSTEIIDDRKALCFESCLLELASLKVSLSCQRKKCAEPVSVTCRYTGTAVQLVWTCANGHRIHTWNSQPRVRRIFAGNILASTAILLSGNNFQKIALFAKFLNMCMVSSSTHQRIQKLFTAPAINRFYDGMMGDIQREGNYYCSGHNGYQVRMFISYMGWLLPGRSRFNPGYSQTKDSNSGSSCLVFSNRGESSDWLTGSDGRNDSPGHSAMYCTYTFMEYETKDIICSVTVDKRMTQLKSTNMEKEGFMRALGHLVDKGIKIVEVCSDAHPQITALMKQRHPEIKHSYDTWHGAKNLGKKLTSVSSENKNKELRPWVSNIINHFWWCSKKAEGSEIALIARWRGMLHHVTNVHEWAIGDNGGPAACEHAPIDPQQENEKWLEPGSDPHSALADTVLSTRLLRTLKFYVNFRHTGELEAFHEHLLMYAAKRFAYTFPMYKARCQLAVIDYQHHKDRENATDKHGEIRYARKFSKRTKNWKAVPVKEKKTYSYIPELLAQVMRDIENFEGSISQSVPLEDDDPRRIRRTIAEVSPESTKTIFEKQKSRFL